MMNHNPARRARLLRGMLAVTCAGAISACGDDTSSPPINGCTDALFVDRTGAAADRTVAFGTGAAAFSYTPQCITVAAGQTVTFSGDLAVHPLAPGSSPAAPNTGTAGNPIPRTMSGTMVRVTFPRAGTYPYFCELHYQGGMLGAVRVR